MWIEATHLLLAWSGWCLVGYFVGHIVGRSKWKTMAESSWEDLARLSKSIAGDAITIASLKKELRSAQAKPAAVEPNDHDWFCAMAVWDSSWNTAANVVRVHHEACRLARERAAEEASEK